MKKKLLFVTYLDEHPEEGFSYVIELAKVLNEDLMVFLISGRRLSRNGDRLIGDDVPGEAAGGQVVAVGSQEAPQAEKKLAGLVYKCKKSGIKVDLYSSSSDVFSAIQEYFRQKNQIDIVLLGPNITERGHITQRSLRRLSDSVARPIVTMAKQTSAEI